MDGVKKNNFFWGGPKIIISIIYFFCGKFFRCVSHLLQCKITSDSQTVDIFDQQLILAINRDC